MQNFGMKYADKRVDAMRRAVAPAYQLARKDIDGLMKKYGERYEKKDEAYRKKLSDKHLTDDDRQKVEGQYRTWLRKDVYSGKAWRNNKRLIEDALYDANMDAVEVGNEEAPKAFSYSANSTSYLMEKDYGVDMGLVAVGVMTASHLYKKKKLSKRKDTMWNDKNIERSIDNSILMGKDMQGISFDLSYNIVKRNKEEIEREVADYMYGADSAGTLEAMERANAEGIGCLKLWIATLDRKTRDAHAELDGQTCRVDEPFEVQGYDIMYPRDPDAAPEMRCNCRCSLGWEYTDYPSESERRENIRNAEGVKPIVADMDYWEWLELKGFDDDY